MKVGLFFMNGIGDHLMLLPALRALEERLGDRAHYVGQDIGVRLLRGELPRMRFTAIPWARGPHGGYEFQVDAALEALRDATLCCRWFRGRAHNSNTCCTGSPTATP